jgi:hypothetical protein
LTLWVAVLGLVALGVWQLAIGFAARRGRGSCLGHGAGQGNLQGGPVPRPGVDDLQHPARAARQQQSPKLAAYGFYSLACAKHART